MSIRYLIYLVYTILQKVPGFNLYQVAIINEECVIVMVPKCGTRSIRDAVVHRKIGAGTQSLSAGQKNRLIAEDYQFLTLSKLKNVTKRKKVFAIYRSWDQRIQSCWRQKILMQESYFYFWQYYPWIRPKMSFENFENRVKAMPECIREKHFMSYTALYSIEDITLIDLESLDGFLYQQVGVSYASNKTNA